MIGGQGSSAPLVGAEIFNPATSTFIATGSMANARDGLTATLLAGGKVLAAGGIDATGNPVDGSEVFDPTAASFSLSALLATARTQHTATLLQTGKVLLAGGLAQSGATATAELIDPQDGLTPTIPVATTTAPSRRSARANRPHRVHPLADPRRLCLDDHRRQHHGRPGHQRHYLHHARERHRHPGRPCHKRPPRPLARPDRRHPEARHHCFLPPPAAPSP